MRKHLSTIFLVLVLLLGLSLMLYPTVSDLWNSAHQSKAVATYTETVSELNTEVYDQVWAEARAYNESLIGNDFRFYMSEEELRAYDKLLNIGGNGVMGVVEVPSIGCRMPIYHGTSEGVLQVAIGHIEGTSLPTGDTGTHCAISGHRGLPSARLFTDLDQMKKGDLFMLHVLNETFTYEVDQILVVDPEDVSALAIDPERDYCTLVTCTPYGINTHRMLVRGHRVENALDSAPVIITSDAEMIAAWLVTLIVASPLLFVILLIALLPVRKGKH